MSMLGIDSRVLVVAEIGVNHDGSLARALELVDAAAEAGADACKLQVFRAASLVHPSAGLAPYQAGRCDDADAAAMLARYELRPLELAQVAARIRRRGMLPLATPFSPEDVETIEALDLPAIKIASPDLVNRPLLGRAAATKRPLIVSTGAATKQEIADACRWLRRRASFALLHCISAYPAATEDANLCWIGELAEAFRVPVGFSDHTTEIEMGALAVAAGARLVEKHLTYDRSARGPDHAASFDPRQFARYVQLVRMAAKARGTPGRSVLECEGDVRRISRQSLVLARAVEAGQVVRRRDLAVQRPGTGIPAGAMDDVVGRRARRGLKAGTMLQWDMLCEAA